MYRPFLYDVTILSPDILEHQRMHIMQSRTRVTRTPRTCAIKHNDWNACAYRTMCVAVLQNGGPAAFAVEM